MYKQQIIVVGYYNHNNIGDEQYKYTFSYIFNTYLFNITDYNIIFIDCDLIKTYEIIDTDIIILGGGDILNDYFLDEINLKFENKPNKILAVSVGLPYNDLLINTNKLNIIDFIFLRTQQDLELVSFYFDKNKIFYLPDLSYYLLEIKPVEIITSEFNTINKTLQIIKNNGKKIICFSFNRHIYNKSLITNYEQICNEFYQITKYLLAQNYYIVFLPFNTSDVLEVDVNMENDILMQNNIYTLLQNTNWNLTKNVMNITSRLLITEILKLYDYFYLTIPMRFHACLFSIYKKIPLIPIYTTKKIKNLLLDINWNYSYELEKDEKDIPIVMNKNNLILLISYTIYTYNNNLIYLNDACTNLFGNNLTKTINKLTCLIELPYIKTTTWSLNYNYNIIDKLSNKLCEMTNYTDFRLVTDDNLQNQIVNVVSYYLTNNLESKYNYGLKIKMFDQNIIFDYNDEWMWILKDVHKNNTQISSNANGLFNINYVDQCDYSKVHRSGWQYVYDNIKNYHNINSNLLLDLYLDRTFHWQKQLYKLLGLIPYKTNWVGFIHHTFDTTFSDYNNYNLLNDPDFIESLKCCKGLFVLSNYLKNKFVILLEALNINIPVFSFTHPTDDSVTVKQFSFKNFIDNPSKKILHVGCWLRDIFSFYNLNIPLEIMYCKNTLWNNSNKTTYKIEKVILKNNNTDNYYPPGDFLYSLKNTLTNLEHNTQNIQNISTNSFELKNNWFKHYYNYTEQIINSVKIIEKLNNDDYDTILSENIIFLKLVDASAVNTVIECIIRNTPIIINKHPAVIELLGDNYPLYYSNNLNYYDMNVEINNLLINASNIYKAYEYIKNLDKTKFNVTFFVDQLIKSVISITSFSQ